MRRILSIALLLAFCAPAFAEEPAKRPNILFLFADDMRADVIGALGNATAQTPNLDKLVKAGTSFTRNYIMGGNQGAVCVPSRAMMLTGKSMFTVPTQISDTPTWPILLRRAGYATFMTGKWHNGPASAAASFPGAHSVFLGGMSNHFAMKVTDIPTNGVLKKKDLARVEKKHSSELFADEAIRFLHENRKQPWALYVAFTAPHDPRQSPPEWQAKFDPAKMPLPANFLPEHPFNNGELKIRDEQLEKWPRTPDAVRRHLADYHAIIAHLDAQIGRILAALAETGELDNTVIIFAADNGLAIGSHGLFGKQNVYEHSVRVPLIVRAPGVAADRRTDAMTYLLDLCPTICELAGVAPPENIHGRSIVPVLRGERATHRDAMLFAYRDFQRAAREDRFKVIHYPRIDRWQLFDLKTDPDEMRDLVGDPAQQATLAGMKTRLAQLRTDFGDKAKLQGEPDPR
jgi:arylsulfatase A-like enzyme